MLDRLKRRHPIEDVQQVVSAEELLAAQEIVKEVHVDPSVSRYIVDLVRATRSHGDVALGVSPRGTLALYRAAQARAALDGRGYVLPDDVKRMGVAVLSHRIIVAPEAALRGVSAVDVIQDVLDKAPIDLAGGGQASDGDPGQDRS